MTQCKLKEHLGTMDKKGSLCHLGLCLLTNITKLVKKTYTENKCY